MLQRIGENSNEPSGRIITASHILLLKMLVQIRIGQAQHPIHLQEEQLETRNVRIKQLRHLIPLRNRMQQFK